MELHPDSAKPEMVFMDQVEEVSNELAQVKNEQCIVIRMRDGKIILTNPVSHSFFMENKWGSYLEYKSRKGILTTFIIPILALVCNIQAHFMISRENFDVYNHPCIEFYELAFAIRKIKFFFY